MNEQTNVMQEKQKYNASFSHYLLIDYEPYYTFTTSKVLLVKCRDYPELIGELRTYERVNLTAEIQEICKDGIILKKVEWRPVDE